MLGLRTVRGPEGWDEVGCGRTVGTNTKDDANEEVVVSVATALDFYSLFISGPLVAEEGRGRLSPDSQGEGESSKVRGKRRHRNIPS